MVLFCFCWSLMQEQRTLGLFGGRPISRIKIFCNEDCYRLLILFAVVSSKRQATPLVQHDPDAPKSTERQQAILKGLSELRQVMLWPKMSNCAQAQDRFLLWYISHFLLFDAVRSTYLIFFFVLFKLNVKLCYVNLAENTEIHMKCRFLLLQGLLQRQRELETSLNPVMQTQQRNYFSPFKLVWPKAASQTRPNLVQHFILLDVNTESCFFKNRDVPIWKTNIC